MRKLLILVLVLSLCITSVSAAVGTDGTTDQAKPEVYDELAASVIQNLRLIDNCEDGTREITRGEFVSIVLKFGKRDVEANSNYAPVFIDVDMKHEYYKAITMGANIGIVSVDDIRRFRPDDAITMEEALQFLLRMMGYEQVAQSRGGYPNGYINVASGEGFLSKLKNVSKITCDAAVQLLYNALNAGFYEVAGAGADVKLSYSKPWAEHRWDLYKIKGVVNTNELTSLINPIGTGKRAIMIGDNLCNYKGTNVAGLLGYSVEAYAYKEDDETEYELVAIKKATSNDITVVKAEDIIEDTTVNTFQYRVDDKSKRVQLAGIDMIYNGKCLSPYSVSDLKIHNGTVTLIDNNNDSRVDVVVVEEYVNYVVQGIDVKNNTIYDKYNQPALHNTDMDIQIVNEDNYNIDISILKQNDVVMVYSSKNTSGEKYIKAVRVNTEPVKGIITSVGSDDGDTLIVIDEQEYKVSPDYLAFSNANPVKAPVIRVGQQATFLQNSEKVIVGGLPNIVEDIYGYLINMQKAKGLLSKTVSLKIFSQSSKFITCATKDKIELNNVRIDSKDLLTNDGLYTTGPSDRVFKPQVIRFRLNSEGELTHIQVAPSTMVVPHLSNKDTLVLNGKEADLYYRSGTKYGNKYIFSDSTVIFNIPNDLSDVDSFSIEPKRSISSDKKYSFDLYNCSKAYVVGAAVMKESSLTNFEDQSKLTIVTNVVSTLDKDGSETKKLYGLYSGQKVEYLPAREGLFDNIREGDLIQVLLNGQNKVKAAKIIFKNSNVPAEYPSSDPVIYKNRFARRVPSNTSDPSNSYDYVALLCVYGVCIAKEENVLALTGYDSNSVFSISVAKGAPVYICNLSGVRPTFEVSNLDAVIEAASLANLNGSKVMIQARNEVCNEVFIIK